MLDPLKKIAELEGELFQLAEIEAGLGRYIKREGPGEHRDNASEQLAAVTRRFEDAGNELRAVEMRYFGVRPSEVVEFRTPVKFIAIEIAEEEAARHAA